MSSEQSLIRHEPTLMEVVQQIIASPNAKDQVEVMRELLAMKEREEDRTAKRVFADALHDIQAEIGPIYKDGTIEVKGTVRSRFATWDNLDDLLKPLMDKYGFSYTQTVVGIKDGTREYAGTLIHRNGHERTLSYFLQMDKSDFRSAAQSEGATSTYAKRQLYKAHFNLNERTPAKPEEVEAINEDQAKDLNTRLQDLKANIPAFLDYFRIADLKELKQADLPRAIEMIDRKAKK